jgi:hypothetical protein
VTITYQFSRTPGTHGHGTRLYIIDQDEDETVGRK